MLDYLKSKKGEKMRTNSDFAYCDVTKVGDCPLKEKCKRWIGNYDDKSNANKWIISRECQENNHMLFVEDTKA